MNCSETLASLAKALAAAQAEVQPATRSGENEYDKYHYARYEDFAAVAQPILAKHALAVLFSADELIALEDRVTRNGAVEHAVRVKVTARLIHESGEWMQSSAWGEGQDNRDKAPYKATTGAKKYLLAGLLAIPTVDDPENDNEGREDPRQERRSGNGQPARQQQRAAPAPPPKAPAKPAPAAGPSTSTAPSTPAASATTSAPPPQKDLPKPLTPGEEESKKRAQAAYHAIGGASQALAIGCWRASTDWHDRVSILEKVQTWTEETRRSLGDDRAFEIIREVCLQSGWREGVQPDAKGVWPKEGFPTREQVLELLRKIEGAGVA